MTLNRKPPYYNNWPNKKSSAITQPDSAMSYGKACKIFTERKNPSGDIYMGVNEIYAEIQENLDPIAIALKCSPEHLFVQELYNGLEQLASPKLSPILSDWAGGLNVLPVRLSSKHKSLSWYPCQTGITYYEIAAKFKEDKGELIEVAPKIVYGLYFARLEDSTCKLFLICKKGYVYRITRELQQIAYDLCKDAQAPVLKAGLLDEILNNSVNFLRKKRLIESYGVTVSRGLVFNGNPGNGKTMTCRYLKAQALKNKLTVGQVSGQLIDATFRKGESLHSLFNDENVIFFDDIDISFLDSREKASSRSDLACAILSAMDGISQSKNVVRIFTTNEDVSNFDTAFVRPGRIDRIFSFDNPTASMRQALIDNWHEEILGYIKEDNLYYEFINESTDGLTFAEINSIKNYLVTNKILNDEWNLDLAIENATMDKEDKGAKKQRKKMGFNSNKHVATEMKKYSPVVNGVRVE